MSTNDDVIAWSGEFAQPRREAAFLGADGARDLVWARLVIGATTLTSLGFAPLDLLTVAPGHWGYFLGIRAIIAAWCVVCLAMVSRPGGHRALTRWCLAHQWVFFSLNALVFDHPVLVRHGGALMPLIAIALFMYLPGSFRAVAAIAAYGPSISLTFWGVLRQPPEQVADLAIIALLTLVAYVVGGIARARLGRMRREEYLHIDRERADTQRMKEAKEAAEAGARAKADFLAVMSHEIRTPLNGVLGMLRLVLDGPLPGPERERLEIASQSAQGLMSILDDILDLSKLEAGKLEFEQEAFSLSDTVRDVVAVMESRIREKGLTLATDIAADSPAWVSGDASRLRQILFNLVGNAVKFTEHGGITVQVQGVPGGVAIVVADTGIGMDPAQQARLFQAFSQADPSISRRFGGTGLGLAVCRRLVEGLGGTIGVESHQGEGSRFFFTLPFAPAPAPVQEAGPTVDTRALIGLNVLVAEDNAVNQLVVQTMLQRRGLRVSLAADGAEAVALVAEGDFDAILMDMQMPLVDGLEATRRIRALDGPAARVPIIALTANATADDGARCLAAGMDAHVAKPFDPDRLLAVIGQVVGLPAAPPPPRDVLLVGAGHGTDSAVAGLLRTRGFRVFPVASGAAAVTMATVRRFDAAVLTGDDDPAVRAALEGAGIGRVVAGSVAAVADALDDGDGGDEMPAHLLGRARALLLNSLRGYGERLGAGDPAVAAIAHAIKGSAATLGFSALAATAAQAMAGLEAGDDPAPWRDRLGQAVGDCIVELEAIIPHSAQMITASPRKTPNR